MDLIYRDVSPRNFMLGTGGTQNVIHLIDLGLAQDYELASDQYDGGLGTLVGTARYTSINGHRGGARCPRDDLQSLGYMLVYFLKGKLPWQGLRTEPGHKKNDLILQMKQTTSVDELCHGLPKGLRRYQEIVCSLSDTDRPDYRVLRQLFKTIVKDEKLVWDEVFDWTERIRVKDAV
ncbi:casein kinase I [Friedmanniomyces endolithicus]|nr:casein kinase I [Friedmanniomyces endolithicus]